jgi:hypothetical protein
MGPDKGGLRVVAKVERHQDELFHRIGFIVTNMGGGAASVVWFYNLQGTTEQWIEENKNAVKWTKRSCHNSMNNQVRLRCSPLYTTWAAFRDDWALPPAVKHLMLTPLQRKLVKIGAEVVRHAKYMRSQLAEIAVLRKLFASLLERIWRLCQQAVGSVPSG